MLRALVGRGHRVTFLERDQPVFAEQHDVESFAGTDTHVYGSISELHERFAQVVREADLVVIGAFVPDGVAVGRWALDLAPGRVAFYDVDTPATLAALIEGTCSYLSPDLVPRYSLYLSTTGGPTLDVLRRTYGAEWVRPLYCAADPAVHFPEPMTPAWDLGYLGPWNKERHSGLARLLIEPAQNWSEGRFLVAGTEQPTEAHFPPNVERIKHRPRMDQRHFYNLQRYTLNVPRRAMVAEGWAPNIRIFEAAACGTPIISEPWPGLDELFSPAAEVLVVRTASDVVRILRELSEAKRLKVAGAARARILAEHTSNHRAETLERYTRELLGRRSKRSRVVVGSAIARSRDGEGGAP
jgi:spore maturation protein CgeB